jgi:hypothetical protein
MSSLILYSFEDGGVTVLDIGGALIHHIVVNGLID